MQHWTAAGYQTNARFVADLGNPVVELLAPHPQELILDLGCGDGVLTQKIAALGATIVGVDSSLELIEAAKSRGINTRLIDAQKLDLPERFDAVFSNAALHWMLDAEEVVANIKKHLKPGGRFVGEFGGHGNVAAIVTALVAALAQQGVEVSLPWYFPTPAEYRQLLESQDFTVDVIELIPRPTLLPTGIEGWLNTFAHPLLKSVPDPEAALAQVISLLKPSLCDSQGQWTADYVRLRFAAHL